MKDISTPVPPHEVRAVIKKSLENAALVNYERLSEEARIEGEMMCEVHIASFFSFWNILADLANPQSEEMIGEVVVPPSRKLEDLIRLAELCVDLLRQNEEFYAEAIRNIFNNYHQNTCCKLSTTGRYRTSVTLGLA